MHFQAILFLSAVLSLPYGNDCEIYAGTQSNVRLCTDPTGRKVISKELFERESYDTEKHFMLALESPFVPKIYHLNDQQNVIAMEYSGEPLLKHILDIGVDLEWDYVMKIITRMVLAVKFVHSLDVIHMDIKLDNFVINDHGKVSLIDFNLASNLSDPTSWKRGGSWATIAPDVAEAEILFPDRKYFEPSKEIDIYSLSACFMYMIIIKNKFAEFKNNDDQNLDDIADSIDEIIDENLFAHEKIDYLDDYDNPETKEFLPLLYKGLADHPSRRFHRIIEIMEHNVFEKIDWKALEKELIE